MQNNYPGNIYLLKVNNRNTKKKCEICLKLTTKTPEQRPFSGRLRKGRRSDIFVVNFEHILHIFLVFLLLTLSK